MRKIYAILISLILLTAANVSAQTITSTAAGGNWSLTTTWVGGVVPTSVNDVVIAATATVTLDGNFACKSVVVNNTGTLSVPANTLTVGTAGGDNKTFVVTGTLTISGGTVTHNGNMTISATTGTFNMSSGNLNIDGNGGTAGTSVASGTSMFSILSQLGTVNGGTITIVDPHFAGTGKVVDYSVSTATSWVGNTLVLGGASGTNSSTGTEGFHVDCYTSTARLLLGHVTANGGSGTNRIGKTATATGNGTMIGGDLTFN